MPIVRNGKTTKATNSNINRKYLHIDSAPNRYALKIFRDKNVIREDLRQFIRVKSDVRGNISRFFRFQRYVSRTHDRP